ncbi:hypothetical protein OQY15_09955 [Pedobacter sp. MC2016-15]|uniref:hypothetical protein n=1 Tax=Pedobacter sp. MC2016-15 TaxID=2994473 RepID=UPI0022455274|nr:hypothetical protein [Pedobacter sp. MC2016-15]MCX2479413.1 hypothetical protein [Pedobacter sp. MC2016-15]
MDVKSAGYQGHTVFKLLDELITYYDWWSFSIMSFMTSGTKSVINIDTYVYSSIQGTLQSIKLVLQDGQINDAYALIRKYQDAIIMNVYTTLYLSDNHSLDNFIVTKIQGWMEGSEQLPNFRAMTNYIKDHKDTKALYNLINKDDRYERIRDRCNNNTHYNFYRNVMLNDSKVYNENRGKYLDTIQHDLKHLILMHLAYIFSIAEHYMVSSDYMDHLECDMTPPEDSEYWVANGVQEIFDQIVQKLRPDIAKHILEGTSMKLN